LSLSKINYFNANLFQNPLTNAFVTGNLDNFKRLVESGVLDKETDESTGISLFEKLCKTPKSADFIRVCLLKFASDPNFLINHFMPTEVSANHSIFHLSCVLVSV
jgi:hypothetical protein